MKRIIVTNHNCIAQLIHPISAPLACIEKNKAKKLTMIAFIGYSIDIIIVFPPLCLFFT